MESHLYVIYLYQQDNDEESDQPRDKGLVFCQNVLRLYPPFIPKTTSITCLQKANFSNVSRLFLPSWLYNFLSFFYVHYKLWIVLMTGNFHARLARFSSKFFTKRLEPTWINDFIIWSSYQMTLGLMSSFRGICDCGKN